MIGVAADTDAASAVSLPRCEATPRTDQATAANSPFFFFFLFALYLSLYISPSLALSLSPFFFLSVRATLQGVVTISQGSPGTSDFPRHIHDNHARSGDPPATRLFDTCLPERHDDPLAHHLRLSKHRGKARDQCCNMEGGAEILASVSFESPAPPQTRRHKQVPNSVMDVEGGHALPAQVS